MSVIDDIVKFCQDLILGDFEDQPSNAAMIVGGLISLIPVVDQVMDVRDVCGMIYRINKRGIKNCHANDWVDLALAAFGCIPEVGSAFKTVVKPLWKNRKTWKFATQRGQSLIELTLGKGKGAAIKFYKTFNWAGNTQLAIQQTMQALDLCDQLLAELAKPRWWVPDSLEDLARQMRPGLKTIRGDLKTGLRQGSKALQDFLKEMLGEDGAAVATQAVAIAGAVVSVHGQGAAHHAHGGGTGKPAKKTPPPKPADKHPEKATQKRDHGQVNGSERQLKSGKESGRLKRFTRSTAQALEVLTYPARGLAGEHIADYHHLKTHLHAPHAWPHGKTHQTGGKWAGPFPRTVADGKRPERAMQIVKADLPLITTQGIDTTWRVDANTLHFVEAKTTMNYYALQGGGARGKGLAPKALNGRHAALWYLLGNTKTKGMQMSKFWIEKSIPSGIAPPQATNNLAHRFAHLIVFTPTDTRAFSEKGHAAPMPRTPSPAQLLDTEKHLMVAAEVLVDLVDENAPEVQDGHKTEHLVTETFLAGDIDAVESARNKYGSGKKAQQAKRTSTKGKTQ